MNKEKLSELLRSLAAYGARRSNDCPDEHEIAAGVDGQLSEDAYKQFESHMADCDFCTSQVGLLCRLQTHDTPRQVPEFVLAQASRLGAGKMHTTIRRAPRWAAAAVVVLAVTLVMDWNSQPPAGPEATIAEPTLPASRYTDSGQARNLKPGLNPGTLAPRVLVPANGAMIDPGSLVFQWTGIPGSLYYDVHIVTDEGDLIWLERVEGTSLGLPEQLQFKAGAEYFVRVDAYLAAAKSISSRHVLFTVREER